jgi:DNA-binding protein HU-beta
VNKAQLVEAIADKMGGRQPAAEAVDAVLDAIVRAVVAGDRVSVTGFGSFEKVDRPARYARNPQTGERVRVKKTSVPRFRAGQGFKDLVSGSKKLPRGGEVAVKKAPKGSLTGGVSATVKKAAAKKAAAKKTTAKKAAPAKAAAKKTTAKKTTAKAAAKKTTAKKTTAKAAAKKTAPAKKSTARKTTAKKTARTK